MRIASQLIFIGLCIHGATAAAVVRKQPAFATPIYSDAYMPAAMQVIFHLADQLKRLEAEELEQNLLSTPSTSPHPPGQKQPLPTQPTNGTADVIETVTVADEEKYYVPPERYQEEALIIAKPPEKADYEKTTGNHVTPEVNHEVSEVVYGLPETNYELPEPNHEIPEETYADMSQLASTTSAADYVPDGGSKGVDKVSQDGTSGCNEFKPSSEPVPNDATTLAVDSVVKEIYSIVKTSSLEALNASSSSQGEILVEKSSSNGCIEGKTSPVNIPSEILNEDNKERADELKDDKRFTLLGERVDQVPRPSLSALLRAANGTTSPSLKLLGDLYDALSKDARRQGLSKFAGYSEKVLKTLQETSGGGAGLQLKELLEKSSGNMELTRYDAMAKTKETIADLNDSGSKLSTDLRRLLPLRYMA